MESNNELNLSKLMEVLQDYGQEFTTILKSKLENDNRRASGELINSIKTSIKINDEYIELTFNAAEYWKFVEYGRKAGKRPPLNNILSWIRAKKILPRPNADGKLPTENQLAFLIQRSIGEHGTIKDKNYDGGHYVASTIQELNQKYIPLLEDALQEDFHNYEAFIIDETLQQVRIY